MIQGLFQSTSLPALQQTAMFAEKRHEILAGNMANLDTPGYRVQDLSVGDFETSLKSAIEAQQNPVQQSTRSPGIPKEDPFDQPRRAMEKLVYHDGSDVNIERQVTEISKNQALHSLAIALMRSQFSTLNSAISERV
jgi:flagellar basal-body rod protein FlgB